MHKRFSFYEYFTVQTKRGASGARRAGAVRIVLRRVAFALLGLEAGPGLVPASTV